jgi:hypothetical protein
MMFGSKTLFSFIKQIHHLLDLLLNFYFVRFHQSSNYYTIPVFFVRFLWCYNNVVVSFRSPPDKFCVIATIRRCCYSLRPLILFANMDVSRHILVSRYICIGEEYYGSEGVTQLTEKYTDIYSFLHRAYKYHLLINYEKYVSNVQINSEVCHNSFARMVYNNW